MKELSGSTSTLTADVSKRGRATLACLTCRRKRIKCSGEKPICGPCRLASRECNWSWEDRRKPYTKEVVDALKQQVTNLERQIANMSSSPSTSSTNPELKDLADANSSVNTQSTINLPGSKSEMAAAAALTGLAKDPSEAPTAAGGLARNPHGELRFFVSNIYPTTFRAVQGIEMIFMDTKGPGSTHILMSSASRLDTLEKSAAHTLTRAPFPLETSSYPPPPPPELPVDFKDRLLRLAFDYALSNYSLVDERRFFADMAAEPENRTWNYSPFLLNVILGIGCRFLDPDEEFPDSICTSGDRSTRGDCFIHWSRYTLEAEWNWPKLSTLRGLGCVALYLTGRALDGLAWLYMGMATLVTESFGLHLRIQHLPESNTLIDEEQVIARRDCFFAVFSTEALLAMHIGRVSHFRPDEFDQQPSPIDAAADFEPPLYRSSASHWSSQLAIISSQVLAKVYTKKGIGLALRRNEVPALHLELQTWYHALPSHLKVSMNDAGKLQHPFIIGLNLEYWHLLLYLHRPFFSRFDAGAITPSTEKCLLAASNIVRLIKIQQKTASGVRLVHPGFVQALFSAGTILVLSSSQNGIYSQAAEEQQRKESASKDLRLLLSVLREVGRTTWSSGTNSANVLDALMATAIPTSTEVPSPDSSAATASAGPSEEEEAQNTITIDPLGGSSASSAFPTVVDDTFFQQAFTMFPSWDFQDQNLEWQINTMASTGMDHSPSNPSGFGYYPGELVSW